MDFEIDMFDFMSIEMLLGECALNLLMIKENSLKENNTLIGIRGQNVIIFSIIGWSITFFVTCQTT